MQQAHDAVKAQSASQELTLEEGAEQQPDCGPLVSKMDIKYLLTYLGKSI